MGISDQLIHTSVYLTVLLLCPTRWTQSVRPMSPNIYSNLVPSCSSNIRGLSGCHVIEEGGIEGDRGGSRAPQTNKHIISKDSHAAAAATHCDVSQGKHWVCKPST